MRLFVFLSFFFNFLFCRSAVECLILICGMCCAALVIDVDGVSDVDMWNVLFVVWCWLLMLMMSIQLINFVVLRCL